MVEKARAGISVRAGSTVFAADDPASVDRFVEKSCREARDVLAPDQMSKFGKTIHPRQFMECPAQRNQTVDIRISCQCRGLGASTSHPPEDVRIAAALLKRTYFRICDAEISKKATNGRAIVANGFGIERGAE
jgi:hypothetical protein